MKQYLLLIENNATTPIAPEQWTAFFERASASGYFRGGSELGPAQILGNTDTAHAIDFLVGYMRFDAENKSDLMASLAEHPVIANGGSVHLIEMPKT